MSEINPIVEEVAARIHAVARGNSGRSFEHLEEWNKAEWRRRAGEVIQPMLDAAAEAYSRGGRICDADCLDVETEEIAGSVGRAFTSWRRAFRSSTEEHLAFPNAAVGAGLSALAALRAAFGWTPTPTAPEITESLRDSERQTPARDGLRLHLAAAHGYPIALGAGDGEAVVLHDEMHRRVDMLYPHPADDRSWSEDEVRNAIAKLADEGYPPEQFYRPLREHLERAPHTVVCDDLRLHLLARHCLINAAELADHAVLDAHAHEHDGPGTIRNHPRDDRSWTIEKIHDVLDDLRDDPAAQNRYLAAADLSMDRIKGRTR
jgi:hypothetical protein